jgi:hypothetical protein
MRLLPAGWWLEEVRHWTQVDKFPDDSNFSRTNLDALQLVGQAVGPVELGRQQKEIAVYHIPVLPPRSGKR